uniref:Uncharacterized protein n=1 Tax=Caenorhabditis japonica TaxID=281687 RepID=A0A8R1HX12_CAEJA
MGLDTIGKSISNPFLDSQYYDDEGSDVMTNYAYTRSEMCAYGLFELENSPKFADKFFHPHDPLFIYQSGQICPVTFNNSCGKFHCHVRDRSLTVVYNNDFIETFRIARDTSTWQRVWQTRLSTRYGSPCPLRYRFDTVPGHACLLDAPLIGDPLKLLYDTSKFHTPIAQDAKSLLWRDQPEWFAAYETIRENEPVITRCHLIDDDLLALTVSYSDCIIRKKRAMGGVSQILTTQRQYAKTERGFMILCTNSNLIT